jgi:hypothetical protein
MLGAILLALLPLVELVDHWETFGSDPEFVSVCTVLGIAFALVVLIRGAVQRLIAHFRTVFHLPSQSSSPVYFSVDVIQTVFPRIRAPIRV